MQSKEAHLYIAIITQAFVDLNITHKSAQRQYIRTQALNWLLYNTSDFIFICEAAGWDPLYVRMKAREQAEKPVKVRAKAFEGSRYMYYRLRRYGK